MKDLYLRDRRPVRLGVLIGQGAEGDVYTLADDDGVCVKVHHDRGDTLGRRLDAAIRLAPTGWALAEGGYWRVAWPRHVVYDEHGIPCGALMVRVRGVQLTEVFDAETRAAALDDPTWATCLGIAYDIASVFAELHRARVVVGDISPKNILVNRDGHASLIDCDSMQFTGPDAVRYPVHKVTAAYAPPIRRGASIGWLDARHDVFGLGILICQILMAGEHSYDGMPTGDETAEGIADNIRLNANRLVNPDKLVATRDCVPSAVLPPRVRALAHRCFGPGWARPEERPTAGQWAAALRHARAGLVTCPRVSRHRHHNSLLHCVWCEQRDLGIGEHFPPAPPAPPAPSAAQATARSTSHPVAPVMAQRPVIQAVPPVLHPTTHRHLRPPPDYGHHPPGRDEEPLPVVPAPRRRDATLLTYAAVALVVALIVLAIAVVSIV